VFIAKKKEGYFSLPFKVGMFTETILEYHFLIGYRGKYEKGLHSL